MNYKMVLFIIGRILKIEAVLLLLPAMISIFYKESNTLRAFLIPAAITLIIGMVISFRKPKKSAIFAREGFTVVALSWILLSLLGALPFYLSKSIPSYIDCIFETVSGFTTTGSSILTNIEALPLSILFWRSFTHWIGGMGILVFVLAILPQHNNQSMYLMRAEVPGPTVGKLVSKIGLTARILYAIYVLMTIIEIILLIIGGMPIFDSVVHSFGTAGTGGFAIKNISIAAYDSAYLQYIIAIFMILFGINFNMFYFLLMRKFLQVFKSEELRCYLAIIAVSTIIISINTYSIYENFSDSFRHAFFQVSSIITTTGYATTDFNNWPLLSKCILVALMFFGACAGSTGGGIKISRIIILFKTGINEIRQTFSPKSVHTIKFDGKPVETAVSRGIYSFFIVYMMILAISILLISFDNFDFTTTTTAVISCINNIGPGLEHVGPMGNFADFSPFAKLVLSFDMLAGRLEIFPIFVLFYPKIWMHKKKLLS